MKPTDVTLAIPEGLSAAGRKAAETIIAILRRDDRADTGGCRAFYVPSEWAALGNKNVRGAELVVVYDGGVLRDYFEGADYAALRDRTIATIADAGFRVERCNGYCSAIYADG